MHFVTPIVAVSPMRLESAHRSEMVSQLLFGETAIVLEKTSDFTKIKTVYDDYIGWCQNAQLIEVSAEAAQEGTALLNSTLFNGIYCNGQKMQIPFGCPLHFFKNGQAQIGHYQFENNGETWDPAAAQFDVATIKQIAFQYINTAYLWGGRTVFGIDCSGFAQQVFRFLGIQIPRDAYQQAALGELVGFLQEAKCGDLAFFDNAEGKITHVGIMLDNATIIHSSGKVRIDPIDNMGIISSDTDERTHQLRIIKRYSPIA